MFSDHDEISPSIAAVSAPSVACSMLAVQQQKQLIEQKSAVISVILYIKLVLMSFITLRIIN